MLVSDVLGCGRIGRCRRRRAPPGQGGDRMDRDDLRGLGRLAGLALAGGVKRVEELHTSIAGRAFRGAGPTSAPVRAAHDVIAHGVYTAVRGTLFHAATT